MPGTAVSRKRSLFARLRASRRGSALIEFTMVAAPFIAMTIASLETALVFFTQQGLQTAAETAARTISTGAVQSAGTTQSQFKTTVCGTLMPYLKCSNLYVDIQEAATFADVDTSNPTITYDSNGNPTNSFAYEVGGSGSIVILRLMYVWPISTGPLGLTFGASNGRKLIVATTVAKTEPY